MKTMNLYKKHIIKKFIHLIDKKIKVEFQDGVLECAPEYGIVYIGTENTLKEDKLFMNFVEGLYPECQYNPFIMGILHEVFHIITYDEKLDEQRDNDYALLLAAREYNIYTEEEFQNEYFRIPLEFNATMGGIQWAKEHSDIMEKYNKIIKY